jgi:hypothetical protein
MWRHLSTSPNHWSGLHCMDAWMHSVLIHSFLTVFQLSVIRCHVFFHCHIMYLGLFRYFSKHGSRWRFLVNAEVILRKLLFIVKFSILWNFWNTSNSTFTSGVRGLLCQRKHAFRSISAGFAAIQLGIQGLDQLILYSIFYFHKFRRWSAPSYNTQCTWQSCFWGKKLDLVRRKIRYAYNWIRGTNRCFCCNFPT